MGAIMGAIGNIGGALLNYGIGSKRNKSEYQNAFDRMTETKSLYQCPKSARLYFPNDDT